MAYQLVSRYSTYFRMAVPVISALTFFIPLYLEPMMRALKKKFFNRTSQIVSSQLSEDLSAVFTGLILFPVAFLMASFLAALPFDALFLWTMKQPYDLIKAIKADPKFDFLSKASYVVIGINNLLGIAFSIFGIFYLVDKEDTLGYVEGILWDMMISWGVMQVLQDISLASFQLYLAEFV